MPNASAVAAAVAAIPIATHPSFEQLLQSRADPTRAALHRVERKDCGSLDVEPPTRQRRHVRGVDKSE
jgi:hypothetical protein